VTPDSILGQFGKMGRRSKVNLLSPIWFDCCLLAVLCCHLATENVMKLLFGLLLRRNTVPVPQLVNVYF